MYNSTKARKTAAHFENIDPLWFPCKVMELFPEETQDQISQYHSQNNECNETEM